MLQVGPTIPLGHVQTNPSGWLAQVPPFEQGLLAHGSIAVKFIIKLHFQLAKSNKPVLLFNYFKLGLRLTLEFTSKSQIEERTENVCRSARRIQILIKFRISSLCSLLRWLNDR